MINIHSSNLVNKNFIDIFSEIFELENVIENNIWHFDQSVFDHTIGVLENWERISSDESELITTNILSDYLDKESHGITRRDMMTIMILYHDIGKKTSIEKYNKDYDNPSHEYNSSVEWIKYSDKFGISDVVKDKISDLILKHGLTHQSISGIIYYNRDIDLIIKTLNSLFGDESILMMMFCYADVQGSDLNKHDLTEYNKRLEVIKLLINKILENIKLV